MASLLSFSRLCILPLTLALAPFAVGCTMASDNEAGDVGDQLRADDQAITDVNHSSVKRQSIGNCWAYATVSWVEAMHRNATGRELNVSESYISFWHWFEGITQNNLENGEISTGGTWTEATHLMTKYGVVTEADFISAEATAEMSARQDAALKAINVSLKTGALKSASARRNPKTVLAELVKAWKLSASVVSSIHKVMGADGSGSAEDPVDTRTGTIIKTTNEIPAAYTPGPGKPMATKTLADACSEWQEAYVPSTRTTKTRRAFEKRFQRALHDGQPVIMSWHVDFNSLDSKGRFMAPPATPGRQGGHMTVMEDYEIDNVPGFGTLKVGVRETRREALAAALSDTAVLKLIRVKNSWGSSRPDREFVVPGYHDLYMKYLNGPVKAREEDDAGNPVTTNCWNVKPFQDTVLPPGY